MIGRLRPTLQPVLHLLVTPLARAGVSPDVVSIAALPLAVLAGWELSHDHIQAGFWWGLAAALIDLLDGPLARLQARSSPYGNYLETMIDRMVEVILLLGVCQRWPLAASAALGTSMLVSYAKARVALVIITDNHDWPAWGERPERLIVFLTACQLSVWYPPALHLGLWLLVVLCTWGTFARMAYAHTLIAAAEHNGTLVPYLVSSPAPPGPQSQDP